MLAEAGIVDIVQIIRDGGIIALLLVILLGGARGWWVFGNVYRDTIKELADRYQDMRTERDEWRRQAMRGTTNAERATAIAEAIQRALDEGVTSGN